MLPLSSQFVFAHSWCLPSSSSWTKKSFFFAGSKIEKTLKKNLFGGGKMRESDKLKNCYSTKR